MQVSDALGNKPKDAPGQTITCESSLPLDAAIAIMAEHNIGAVVVTDDGKVVGVFSERDLVKGLHAHGPKFLEMRLAQAMVTKID